LPENNSIAKLQNHSHRARRVLFVNQNRGSLLRTELVASGYETAAATLDITLRSIADYSPDVVIFELLKADLAQHIIALARRLRAEPATYSLPLLFCYDEDGHSLRNALLSVGADDYFPASIPTSQVLARLDSLFWRIEAGRRAALASSDQRIEIDNFMLLLDSIGDEIRCGANGSVALVRAKPAAGGPEIDRDKRDRLLREVYGFLKLNLRRADSITYYGPTTLLIYMPRVGKAGAIERLGALGEDLRRETGEIEVAIGVASFPDDGGSVESIIETAEAAAKVRQISPENQGPAQTFCRPPAVPVSLVSDRQREEPRQSRESEPAAHIPPIDKVPADFQSEQLLEVEIDTPQFSKAIPLNTPEAEPILPTIIASSEAPQAPVEPPVELRTSQVAIVPPVSEPSAHASKERALHENLANEMTGSAPKGERKTFFSSGLDSLSVRQLSMAEIVERVTATRSRPQAISDIADEASQAAASELEIRRAGAPMPRRLLLVVSDTKRMAALNALVRRAGYEARAAFDGRQALDLLRLERPDVVVMDFKLAGMDGLETLRRLGKETGDHLNVPVVLLVPEEETQARNEAAKLGVHQIVASAYSPANLLVGIRLAGS
jgi:DNA-binding response OmpR family regulator